MPFFFLTMPNPLSLLCIYTLLSFVLSDKYFYLFGCLQPNKGVHPYLFRLFPSCVFLQKFYSTVFFHTDKRFVRLYIRIITYKFPKINTQSCIFIKRFCYYLFYQFLLLKQIKRPKRLFFAKKINFFRRFFPFVSL